MTDDTEDQDVLIIETTNGIFYHEDFCRCLQERADHALALVAEAYEVASLVPVDPLEVAELQSRLARLEADNAAATTWGAAVGARQEDIDGIRKRLRDLCGYGLRPHVRYQAERDRCLRIIQAARSGDIDTDMRTLIHLISSGRDVVLNEETGTYRLAD